MMRLHALMCLTALSFLMLQSCGKVAPQPDTCPAQTYGEPAQVPAPLRSEGGRFKDTGGGTVILRGINMAGNSKVPPFTPITDASTLDPLPGWGINLIRLIFTWEAYEPTRCSYNESYLSYYERATAWARERGIYVIVDFHQDAYSRFSINGCGDGFPPWAVPEEIELITPDNGEACSSWGVQMLVDLSHHQTWADFHRDTYGAKTRYLNMVESVAERMAKHPNVIGYDIINEPWGTDAELHDLYEKIAARIRGRHPDTILFVPPHAIDSSGMSTCTIEKPLFDNFAFSPHYYDGVVLLMKAWLGASPADALNRLRGTAVAWECPMLLGEFGAPAETAGVEGYMEAQFDWLDSYWVSSAQWNYTPGWREDVKDGWNMEDLSITDVSGNTRANFTPRPYPQRIAGTPGEFVRDDNGFTLTWENNPATGFTVVYLPPGYADCRRANLNLPAGANGSCEQVAGYLRCSVSGPGSIRLTFSR
ncbi:MAG: cellulase family glycosylhydrolase [Spirochaetes bacterium]|nr:cellulase family glycosylhydrolase [Spirochaetota bacterium]